MVTQQRDFLGALMVVVMRNWLLLLIPRWKYNATGKINR